MQRRSAAVDKDMVSRAREYLTPKGFERYWVARRDRSLRKEVKSGWSAATYSLVHCILAEHGRKDGITLDYGTGAGFFVPLLLEHAQRVYAVDLAASAVNRVRCVFESKPVVAFQVGPYAEGLRERLRAEGDEIDLFFLNSVLCHWPDEMVVSIFSEFQKVACNSACWIVGEPSCVIDPHAKNKRDPRCYWMFPRFYQEIENLTGLSLYKHYEGSVVYLVLKKGK